MKNNFLTVLGTVLLLSTNVWSQDDLPVSQVVLFSSGVGYFEHTGQVSGDATVRLGFKQSEINDVLKSLLLQDVGGGTIDVVRYPSQDPLSRALQSFSINLDGALSIETLLDRLRGTEVTVTAPSALTGRLLGVERRPAFQTTGTSSVQTDEIYLNLWTANGIQSLPFRSVNSIQPTDSALREEFQKALMLIAASRNIEKKIIDIGFRGRGQRQVRIGYISEAPVWKTSYRLDLSNSSSILQAWAIVENVTEQDWRNVKLSLVSGQPVSFVQDLYTPLYNARPVIRPALTANVQPRSHAQGFAAAEPEEMAAQEYMRSRDAPAPAPAMTAPSAGAVPNRLSLADSGVVAAAQGGRAGELYQFTVATPVTIARRQSALIPLYNGRITAEKVSLYNQSVFASHPMNGAYLENSSGNDLPPGPVTVLDGSIYAGDALLESTPQGQKRLLTYGVDLQLPAQVNNTTSSETVAVRIVRGVLSFQRKATYTTEYRFNNSAAAPKTVLVEHPLIQARTLKQPSNADERTPTHYRFRLTVPAGTTNTLRVVEEQPTGESIALLGSPRSQILSYSSSTAIPPRVREVLTRAADLKQRQEALNAEIQTLSREKSQIENGQGRIRDNIETVGRDSPQGQRYLQRLMDDENKIDALARQLEEKQTQLRTAQTELENYLKDLNVE